MSDPAAAPVLELSEVSLCYRLAKQTIPSLKEFAIQAFRGSLTYEELWALNEVSLAINHGDTVGVLGRNGAGKSTLLKVISGVLKPTRGKVVRRGWIVPILELGTGFDFELTGYENVYLNALLLGRQRKEIDLAVDGIVAFSGLGEFIHSPIRNYSSGMLARLGFSIATAWKPDILILDEILGVGDAKFVRRCERRIAEFQDAGTTILIVSHDAEAVRSNCRRALWLERGHLVADGPTDEVLCRYQEFVDEEAPARTEIPAAGGVEIPGRPDSPLNGGG